MHGTKAKETGSYEYDTSFTCPSRIPKNCRLEKKRSASHPTRKNLCTTTISLSQLHYNISNCCCLFHQLEGLFPVWSQGRHHSTLQETIANGPAATPLLGEKTHGEVLRLSQRNTTKIHVSKTWQHMYQDCMCSLRGQKKDTRCVFFSVFSNSTSFLKPKCLEDPKLFPMLPFSTTAR